MSIWLNPRFLVYEPPLKERPSFRAHMRASWQLAPCCQVKYELWRLKEILTADGAFISHQLGHFTYICLSPQSNFLLRFPTLLLFLILGRCRSNNWSPNDLAIFCKQMQASGASISCTSIQQFDTTRFRARPLWQSLCLPSGRTSW